MSELDGWLAMHKARDDDRVKRREEWELLTDQRRAWIDWCRARGGADRLGVLFETSYRSTEAARAWNDIRAAALTCLYLRVPGPNWRRELAVADERIRELEPRLSRPEWRQQLRE
jgi:hypothetical protein